MVSPFELPEGRRWKRLSKACPRASEHKTRRFTPLRL
jgi:hypothetical protein